MKAPEVILAKTPKDHSHPQPAETLVGHSQAVMNSFKALFGTANYPSRLAEQWLHFFKLKESNPEFWINGDITSALHDIGKANSGFQQAVHGNRDAQAIRHEHLSGLLLMLPDIQEWLEGIPLLNLDVVTCAIIGHHLKVDRASFGQKLNADLDTLSINFDGISEVIGMIANPSQRSLPAFSEIPEVWSFKKTGGCFDLRSHREQVTKKIAGFRRRLQDDGITHRLLMAVRTALILADSAGSGLMREGKYIENWIRESFDEAVILDGQAVENKVIEPRISQIARERNGFQWQGFQMAAEHLPERALLLASCGSGKTLAAWQWIKGQTNRRPVSRIIFLYPTRGTATEGFRDYVSWAPEADAALIHGTSTFDLEGLFENCQDSRHEKDFTTEDRLFALGYWPRRIFSATVDQFLGFMQHVYSSTCLMPLLVDSVVVFDEVHSFDRNLFSAFKRFLKEFDVPVLCMTASLPPSRSEELREYGLTVFPENAAQFPDLQLSAEMPRYHVVCLEGEQIAQTVAMQALFKGKRVLWVVNTVNRCQRLAMSLHAICYHSRFKLKDRNQRHNQVISAFTTGQGGLLAVTTQVCEMSLDLDADVLVSEIAPITSLIQRMGRCNRHAKPGQGKIGNVFFYPPEKDAPYRDDELDGVKKFLEALDGNDVSQSQLEALLEKYGPAAVEPDRYAAFLESGPWAMAREETLREDDQFTEQALLDSDVEQYLELIKGRKPTDGLLISVPRRFAMPDSRTGYLRVVPSSHYHPEYGFLDKPLEVSK